MKFKKFFKKLIAQRKKFNNEKGFTLLELLVVVAIMAAIAGTATIALQDTDMRASAAAHVAMMDELNKGVRTFRVLNRNVLPNNLDSLCYVTAADDATTAVLLPNGSGTDGDILGIEDSVEAGTIIADVAGIMSDIGMTDLRYIDATGSVITATDLGYTAADCTPVGGVLQETVASRSNNMVAGNIFNGEEGNGCGQSITLADGDTVAYWTGAIERILGPGEYEDAAFDATAGTVSSTVTPEDGAVAPVFLAVGFGPSSNLFNTEQLGGMTSVPVYRHVNPDQYNRFIGLFKVAESTYDATGTAWGTVEATDQVAFIAVVDGAGDTKEEELGEWDGTRNTI
nr:type II secretion system protein [uncultured Desulfobacter sp.]